MSSLQLLEVSTDASSKPDPQLRFTIIGSTFQLQFKSTAFGVQDLAN